MIYIRCRGTADQATWSRIQEVGVGGIDSYIDWPVIYEVLLHLFNSQVLEVVEVDGVDSLIQFHSSRSVAADASVVCCWAVGVGNFWRNSSALHQLKGPIRIATAAS